MMKLAVSVAVTALLLLSCATLPKAERETDSLVVGSFVMDYPDGFFGEPPRSINSGVRLQFTNRTRNTQFAVTTASPGGYFTFLGTDTDEYELTSFSYDITVDTLHLRVSGGGNVSYRFSDIPRCVLYVGHLVATFGHPRLVKETGAHSSSWDFDRSLRQDNRQSEVPDYLQGVDPDTPWLSVDLRTP